MTEHKFTDEDIIKALGCCIKTDHFGDCFLNDCPFVSEHGCKVGKETLYPYALDLINRQKAEIEEKSKRLREVLPIVAELKAEAVKEFAHFLIDQSKGVSIRKCDLPDLVIKMIGETK